MLENKEKDHMLLTIHATVERESTALLNLDHITIKDYQRDKKPYQDHTEEYFALVVSSQESSEPSYSNKWKPSRKLRELPENDYLNFDHIIFLYVY